MTDQPTTDGDLAQEPEGAAPYHAGGGHRRRTVVGLAAALALAAGAITVSLTGHGAGAGPPPQPAVAASQSTQATPARPTPPDPSTPAASTGNVLPASLPVTLDVPAIGVHTSLLELGRNTDGTVQVPWQPLKAGWYKGSPTPGQLGASVILGHVDSKETGPAVFYRLGALTPGTRITVTRADRTIATFTTDTVREYPKDHFPTLDVYSTTADQPQLRLITCGNWDARTHSYLGNIVASATLTTS
ncbi:class F sortase [Streptomyces sp. H10-C2]|uniref:class F sortase n=1 Tax=unclassified Streptomyces TaxID=2593676 RepID=UPI0024BAAFA1|nr:MULTISPECIES: class F sortase [unclassified Streptomyces]MDJ0341019.1 class F sortase [Streptomyces sp. PH10-H1]MDJ0369749.1 class F sortase [Streptomyces sp. H10-C2]